MLPPHSKREDCKASYAHENTGCSKIKGFTSGAAGVSGSATEPLIVWPATVGLPVHSSSLAAFTPVPGLQFATE